MFGCEFSHVLALLVNNVTLDVDRFANRVAADKVDAILQAGSQIAAFGIKADFDFAQVDGNRLGDRLSIAAIIDADLPDSAAEDSYSMLPALLGQDRDPIRQYVLQQGFGGARYLAIRRGQWKYLAHQGSGGNRYESHRLLKKYWLPDTAPDAPAQLYDLEKDPGETKNLYFEHPTIVAELKSLLQESITSGRSVTQRK